MDKITEIKNLIKQLNQYSYEYYTLGQPTISDETYDKLYDKLAELERETNCILSNSPTQKVGNVIWSKLEKSTHKYPMLSLDKIKYKDIDKLYKWINNRDCIAMFKMDGLTIDLTYIDGNLVKAETRGNGIEGENITHNAKTFSNIPLRIPYNEEVHIMGEAIIDYETFDNINSKLPEDKKYKNARNLCSGSVRQLDSSICKSRNVKFYGYIVEGTNFQTKISQLKFIEQLGFDVVGYKCIFKGDSNDYIDETINVLKEEANDKGLPIDGLVFMYNDIEYGKLLGMTSHHPLHSVAVKFTEDMEITTLRNIEWSLGRTGQITPVAIFDRVELCGTSVNRASLHNLTILKSLELGIGDEISVIKANEIIPQIVDNLTKSNNIKIPTHCPCCDYPTTIECENESEMLVCRNPNCKAQLIGKISHYCSRNAMNIEGLSEKTIEKFIDKGFIKDISSIYKLEQYKNEIINMEGFGEKSYNRLINSINKSEQCKLGDFIFALGISNVGKSTSKDLANNFKTIDKLVYADYNDIIKIKDMGDVTARSIIDYFNDTKNIELLDDILSYLTFIDDKDNKQEETTGNIFSNQLIYATGTFANYKKDQLKQLIESNGGIFANGYSKKLDLLIEGSLKSSGKVDKAHKDGIKVISEDEFIKMVGVTNV